MTGLEFNTLFGIKWDEQYSDFIDNTRRAYFCDMAVNFRYRRSLRQYEETDEISNELLGFVRTVTAIPSAGNIIDISRTSTDVPNYKKLTDLLVTYVVGPTTYRNRATPMKKNEKYTFYGSGNLVFPVYEYGNYQLIVHPTGIVCTSADVDYITLPEYIDLTDNTTQLNYREDWLDDTVLLMIKLCDGTFENDLGFNLTEMETRITQ